MYRVERKKSIVQLGLGDEVLNISVGGMGTFKKYIEAQGRLVDIQKKLEAYEREKKDAPLELMTLLGETIVYIFEILFGEENTAKIVAFFEEEYDEMLTALLPFITKEVLPKIKENASAESAKLAQRIAGDVPSESK